MRDKHFTLMNHAIKLLHCPVCEVYRLLKQTKLAAGKLDEARAVDSDLCAHRATMDGTRAFVESSFTSTRVDLNVPLVDAFAETKLSNDACGDRFDARLDLAFDLDAMAALFLAEWSVKDKVMNETTWRPDFKITGACAWIVWMPVDDLLRCRALVRVLLAVCELRCLFSLAVLAIQYCAGTRTNVHGGAHAPFYVNPSIYGQSFDVTATIVIDFITCDILRRRASGAPPPRHVYLKSDVRDCVVPPP